MTSEPGSILALDVGNVRIGAAVSDPTQTIATPIESLRPNKAISEIDKICSVRNVVLILVGMPYLPSGELGTQANLTIQFIQEIKTAINIPIETIDERMSTIEAKSRLKDAGYKKVSKHRRQGTIDSASAAVLLENYITR